MITIRPAKADDAPMLWRLLDAHKTEFLDDFTEVTPQWVLEMCDSPDVDVLADAYDLPVGAAWWTDEVADLHCTAHLILDPKYWLPVWRSGTLFKLLETRLGRFRKVKALPMWSQKGAIKLLKRLGFDYRGKLWNETKRKGRPIDVLLYELTSHSWKKRHGERSRKAGEKS